jgi:hypothetical protein
MRGRDAFILSAIVVFGSAGPVRAQSAGAPLSAADVAAACAPAQLVTPPTATLRVVGAQDTTPRALFGPQDLVIVNGGTKAGLQVGQDYFIRREYFFGHRPAKDAPRTIVTAGWLRIVSLNDTTAIARIEVICDGVLAGDYLEPFAAPAAVSGEPVGTFSTLDFSSLARVMFGKDERRIAGTGEFMLLSPGNAMLNVGSHVAIYRDLRTTDVPLTAIAEGVIVSVSNGAPLMRIVTTRDAVQGGDYVVPHK